MAYMNLCLVGNATYSRAAVRPEAYIMHDVFRKSVPYAKGLTTKSKPFVNHAPNNIIGRHLRVSPMYQHRR